MDGISGASGPGLVNIMMLKKSMDMAKTQAAQLLQTMPPPPPPVTPGRVDTYA